MTIGTKIRRLRQEKGYSQENMAGILGISLNAFGKIERDETDISHSRLEQIAKAFDKTAAEFEAYGESNVQYNSNVKCETGSFIANGIVYHSIDTAVLMELEKTKVENIELKKRIEHLEKIIHLLENR